MRFDGVSTAPLCGHDAATRGVARKAGRRGGGAEFEAAAPIPSFTRKEASPTDLFRLGHVPFFWEPSSSPKTRHSVAGRGPVSGHEATSSHTGVW